MFFKEKEIKACGLPVCAWPDCDGSCGATDPEQLIKLLQKQAGKQEQKENASYKDWKEITYLDWIKLPDTSAEDIVKFVRQPCTSDARMQYCGSFEDCNDCMASYLRSKIASPRKETEVLWI